MSSNEPIVIERTYNAQIEKVWNAITNREQMKQWYFDIADFKAEEVLNLNLQVVMKTGLFFICVK